MVLLPWVVDFGFLGHDVVVLLPGVVDFEVLGRRVLDLGFRGGMAGADSMVSVSSSQTK